ncbi:MAG TPA: hypothetical protein VN700_04845 [Vicinamibacterales bacterium]|nr:hypothetical protein [Vicinamibacterales bacterium]
MYGNKVATLGVGCLFAAFAIAWTYPLITNLSGLVPGDGPGDNLQFLWNFWWVRKALAGHLDVFNTSFLFAPVGAPLTLHTLTLLPAAVAATLLAPLPVTATMNLTILGSLALNGFCAYLLALRLCGDRGAAVLGGLVFGGSSYLAGHLQGHFNLTIAWTVPLFAMAAIEAVRGRRMWAAMAGLVLGITIYTDYYYLIIQSALAIVILATTTHQWRIEFSGPHEGVRARMRQVVAALAILDLIIVAAIALSGGFTFILWGRAISMRTLFNPLQVFWLLAMAWAWMRFGPRVVRERVARAPGILAAGVIGAVVFAVVAAPVILSAVRLVTGGGYVTQTYYWRSAPSGIDLATFVMGPPFHGAIGGYVRDAYAAFGIDSIEAGAWFGMVPVWLAVVAFRRRAGSPVVRQWSVIGAVFAVWALGSHLYVLGANTGMILPATLLRYIPIANNARIPGRAMVVVTLALAVIVSVGAAWWRSSGRRGALALAGLACLFVFESIPSPFPVTTLSVPSFYETLRDRPEPGAVLELPLGMRDGFGGRGKTNDLAMYYQTVHGRPIVGGYLSRLPQSITSAYANDPLLDGLLVLSEPSGPARGRELPDARAAGERLRADGIAFVVLDRASAPSELIDYVEKVLPLTLIVNEGERSFYLVR